MSRVFAAADIGSNTAHLLVAASDGETVDRIVNQSEWLSLGEAVARTGSIPPDQANTLIQVLREYAGAARTAQAERVYVFATEAMRAAANRDDMLRRVARETGLNVEIVPAEREAELSLLGASLDAPFVRQGEGLLFEVGGGSAQIAACSEGRVRRVASLPLGTGRLIADAELGSPASNAMLDRVSETIAQRLAAIPEDWPGPAGARAVASGGVVRGLWRALHPDGEQVLAIEEIRFLAWSAARLSIGAIVQRFQVKPKRAAALLPGALVYAALMERFGVRALFVSQYGVREGAILEMARGGQAWPA